MRKIVGPMTESIGETITKNDHVQQALPKCRDWLLRVNRNALEIAQLSRCAATSRSPKIQMACRVGYRHSEHCGIQRTFHAIAPWLSYEQNESDMLSCRA